MAKPLLGLTPRNFGESVLASGVSAMCFGYLANFSQL